MKYFFTLVMTILSLFALAQERVDGVVYGDDKVVLPFAHIINLTKGIGTVSDANGFFSIHSELGDTLRISFVGFKPLMLRVEPEMISRELVVTMAPDYVELASVWIFANPRYKVPMRQYGSPMRLMALENEKKKETAKPGEIRIIDNDPLDAYAGGLVIYGPFSYFSKEEREKRMAEAAYMNTRQTITFARLMALQQTRDRLKVTFNLSDSALDDLIVEMNQRQPAIQKLTDEQEILSCVNLFITLALFPR